MERIKVIWILRIFLKITVSVKVLPTSSYTPPMHKWGSRGEKDTYLAVSTSDQEWLVGWWVPLPRTWRETSLWCCGTQQHNLILKGSALNIQQIIKIFFFELLFRVHIIFFQHFLFCYLFIFLNYCAGCELQMKFLEN